MSQGPHGVALDDPVVVTRPLSDIGSNAVDIQAVALNVAVL